MQRSPIEWTNFTSNPLQYRDKAGNVVWACIHASPGCLKCYSEALAKRYGHGGKFDVATMADLTPFLNEKELRHMLTYKPAKGQRCFVGDMTDLFGEWVPDELLDQLFAVFALRPDVTWQILTRQAKRMLEYFNGDPAGGAIRAIPSIIGTKAGMDAMNRAADFNSDIAQPRRPGFVNPWPLPNVWLGVSVEDQKHADARIPLLLQTPAAVRFVSYEPALGPVDFTKLRHDLPALANGFQRVLGDEQEFNAIRGERIQGRIGYGCEKLDWIICGGESGPGARPFNLDWARDVIKQCGYGYKSSPPSVRVFVKQLGAHPTTEVHGQRLILNDRKGGDTEEWESPLPIN